MNEEILWKAAVATLKAGRWTMLMVRWFGKKHIVTDYSRRCNVIVAQYRGVAYMLDHEGF